MCGLVVSVETVCFRASNTISQLHTPSCRRNTKAYVPMGKKYVFSTLLDEIDLLKLDKIHYVMF